MLIEPVPSKLATSRGKASIELIIKNAKSDRIISKQTVKQLQFGHGAPGIRDHQSLWVARFNAFREYILKESLKDAFTGDHLIRFFDNILRESLCSPRKKTQFTSHHVFLDRTRLQQIVLTNFSRRPRLSGLTKSFAPMENSPGMRVKA